MPVVDEPSRGGGTLLLQGVGQLGRRPPVVAALLALVVFAVYGRALRFGFVADDVGQILQNPFVLNPYLWAKNFTSPVWAFEGIHSNFYRPLQFAAYWLLYQLAGPNPAVFHLIQLMIYAGTAWLVYRLGQSLCGDDVAALAGALLWVLHPQHVEAAAWAAALPDVGYGFLYLLAFLLFIRAEKASPPRSAAHAWPALALFIGLLFKEAAISFPVMLVAFWFFEDRREELWLRMVRLVPYGVAIGVYLVIRSRVVGLPTNNPLHLSGLPHVLGVGLGLLGQHARLFVTSSGLTIFRTFDLPASLRSPWPWLTLLVLLGAVLLRRRDRVLGFLLVWWLVALLPCLDFRMLSTPLVADRFSYIPSVGLCLAIAYLLLVRLPAYAPNWGRARLAGPAFVVLVSLWAVKTVQTIPHWSGEEDLLQDGMSKVSNSAALHAARAADLVYRSGDLDGGAREYEMAFELDQHSIRPLNSVSGEALLGLGKISAARGRMEEAIAYYKRATRAASHNNAAYDALGSLYFPRGDYARAAEYFSEAVKANPYDLVARFYYGTCLAELGKYREAVEQFRAAREVDPTYWQAYGAEARALEAAGDTAGAARVRGLMPVAK
ncbi:MAG: tetratricopeptide repeat protein [Acidobacteriia bacterium]|nr:tetratricopeptide repeat protein [Terriglobia bacterium]